MKLKMVVIKVKKEYLYFILEEELRERESKRERE